MKEKVIFYGSGKDDTNYEAKLSMYPRLNLRLDMKMIEHLNKELLAD